MKTKGKIEIIIFKMYFVLSPFCVNCKRLCLSLTDQMKKNFQSYSLKDHQLQDIAIVLETLSAQI